MVLGYSTFLHLLQNHSRRNVTKFNYWKDFIFGMNFYEFSIIDFSAYSCSRNRLFLLDNLRFKDDSILLKQAPKLDPFNIASMKKEAMFYEFISQKEELKKYLSAYYGFDNENFILFRKWNKQAFSLQSKIEELKSKLDFNTNDTDFLNLLNSVELNVFLKNTGVALYVFHQNLSIEKEITESIKPYFNTFFPSVIFLFDKERTNYYSDFGNSKQRLFSHYLKSKDQNFRDNLVAIIKSRKDDTIIHNDFKTSNVLIQIKKSEPTIIDWELASLGDSVWDLACLLAEFIAEFYVPLQHYGSLRRAFLLYNTFAQSYQNNINKEKMVGFTAIQLLDYAIQQGKMENNIFVDLAEEFITDKDTFIDFLD